MVNTSVKEVMKEGLRVESNPLIGYVSVLVDEDVYLIEDTVVDEGKYRTVVTISLTPKAMLNGKGRKNYEATQQAKLAKALGME